MEWRRVMSIAILKADDYHLSFYIVQQVIKEFICKKCRNQVDFVVTNESILFSRIGQEIELFEECPECGEVYCLPVTLEEVSITVSCGVPFEYDKN